MICLHFNLHNLVLTKRFGNVVSAVCVVKPDVQCAVAGAQVDTLVAVTLLKTSNVMGGRVHPETGRVAQNNIRLLPCKLSLTFFAINKIF